MQTVYFISGLGASKRAFSFLNLSFCNPIFVDWIAPNPKETLQAYALRLMKFIPCPNPTIVGLSFGGMLATEMAKANPNAKVILLSSNKTHLEFPSLLKVGRYLPVYRWLPTTGLKSSGIFFLWILGATGKPQKAVQKQVLKESDPNFTKWAIDAIMGWRNETIPQNLIHIHGTADKLLPYRLVKAHHTIKGGQHLMVMDKAQEISELLQQHIAVAMVY
jgi:pimeloyl-ACP methyl ester carboxylesterase